MSVYKFTKRVFDFSLAMVLLVFLLPFFLIVSFLIKLEDHGNIFYYSERIGLNGKKFTMYKFRSMFEHADKIKIMSTSDDDFRITKIGRTLRSYKLDELPQLINVFKGEMSFVGPRPEIEYYTSQFKGEERKILEVKPGIADFASIKFRNEGEILAKSSIKDKNRAYELLIQPEKIRLQLEYIKKRGFWLDLRLILKTLKAVW